MGGWSCDTRDDQEWQGNFKVRDRLTTNKGTIFETPTSDLDISNKKYVDDQFPVTHASTTGKTASDHHVKTVSGDIDHDSTLNVHQDVNTTASPTFDELTLTGPGANWKFLPVTAANLIGLQSQTSGANTRLWMFSKDGGGTDNIFFEIFGTGTPTSLAGQTRVSFGYATARAEGILSTLGLPLHINSSGNSEQIILNTDGTTEFNYGEVAFAHEINTKNIQTVGLIYATANINGATLTARNGFTGTGAYTNFTIVGGIITGAS